MNKETQKMCYNYPASNLQDQADNKPCSDSISTDSIRSGGAYTPGQYVILCFWVGEGQALWQSGRRTIGKGAVEAKPS